MSIEHDSSPRLHSRGVQCRVLLEKNEVDDEKAKPVNQSDSR